MNHFSVLIILSILSLSNISAQEDEKSVKVVVIEKSVDSDGNVTETKVVKEGKNAEKYIKEMKISGDNNTWTSDHGEEIEIEKADIKMIKNKKVKMIKKDDDGNEEVIEWEGDGDIPDDIKKSLEEHDIDITMEENDTDVKVIVNNDEGTSKTKIKIVKDKDGDTEDIDIEMEGDELSHEVKKMLEDEGMSVEILQSNDGEAKTITITTDEDEVNTNKVQLGVFLVEIETGVKIDGIIKGSSAEEAGLQDGDIITAIGNKKVGSMDQVVEEIGNYNPDETIVIDFIRDTQNESREVILKARQANSDYFMKEKKENYIFIKKDK